MITLANLSFTGHALQRLIERDILEEEIVEVMNTGEVIEDYPDDTPYPSCLMLGMHGPQPLHLVQAWAPDKGKYIIITAYRPNMGEWEPNWKRRRA